MPLIDVRCTADEPHTSEVMRPLADYPATPPCPACGAPTEQVHLPPQTRWAVDPVVVFQAPDGSLRYPGDASGAMAHRYAKDGFTRIELRNAAEVRAFEAHVNAHEDRQLARREEHKDAMQALRAADSRGELRRLMPGMTRRGRDLARAAMARQDQAPRDRRRTTGFHVEAFSYDHSNRMESRDAHGRRRRD